ncbi:MAG: acetyl-CoA carboxylase biotin carboxyl carrier protein, partial [Bryobacteraceae bacterium]
VILPQAYPAYAQVPAQPSPAAAQPLATLASGAAGTGMIPVKSPIVGTFFESPAPGAPPFVAVGDTVQPGQVLCIIESMKLMNEIEAEAAGIVVARHVENGKPVEYGETLFSLRPL